MVPQIPQQGQSVAQSPRVKSTEMKTHITVETPPKISLGQSNIAAPSIPGAVGSNRVATVDGNGLNPVPNQRIHIRTCSIHFIV